VKTESPSLGDMMVSESGSKVVEFGDGMMKSEMEKEVESRKRTSNRRTM